MVDHQLTDDKGGPVLLGSEVGKGGEGVVFNVQGRPALVAKVYFKPLSRDKADKIAMMASIGTERIRKLSAWPIGLLRSTKGTPAGFLMPKVASHRPIFELYGPKLRLQRFPRADWRFLIHAAANTARAFAAIHEAGHVVGDVNHGNLVVAQDATVRFIDTDSFQITANGRRWLCEVGVDTHLPPELQGRTSFQGVVRTANHDNFGLAVLIFQILCMARHPFSGRFLGSGEPPDIPKAITEFRYAYAKNSRSTQMAPPPGSLPMSALTPRIVGNFERAFSKDGIGNGRPPPSEWLTSLEELSRSLRQCQASPGHYHLSSLTGCPWCEIETNSGFALFPIGYIKGLPSQFNIAALWQQVISIKDPGPIPNLPDPDLHPMTPEKFATNIGRQLRQQYSLAATTLILGLAVSCVFASELGVAGLLGTGIASATLLLAKPKSKLDQISHAYQVAKERWDKIKGRWATADPASPFPALRSSIENKKREYEQLPGDKAHRLQTLQQTVRERQLMAHLNRQRIAGAKVQGVGQSKIIALQSYNIETAADITEQRILGVPGFGRVLAGRLVHWRIGCERRFTFDPRMGIPQSDIDAINRELSIKQRRLEHELTIGVSQLSAISTQTTARRELLLTQALEILPIYAQARANKHAAGVKWRSLLNWPSATAIGVGILVLLAIAADRSRASQRPQMPTPTNPNQSATVLPPQAPVPKPPDGKDDAPAHLEGQLEQVWDAATISVAARRINLFAIRADGGKYASDLRGYISAWGNNVSCQQKAKDTYECRIVRGQINIAEEALRRGWVRLDSGAPVEYQKVEQYARRMQKGLWGTNPGGEKLSAAPPATTPQSASPSRQEEMTDRIGPSFSCAKSAQPLALTICSDQRLSGVDLSFVQAYQALRHANGGALESGLRREAQELQGKVLRECGIPQQGPAISETNTKNCIDRLYTEQRRAWVSRLSGPAYQEATRPIERHIALQRDLVQLGYLAPTQTDGVYDPPTRRAVSMWQRSQGLVETGILTDADALALERAVLNVPQESTSASSGPVPQSGSVQVCGRNEAYSVDQTPASDLNVRFRGVWTGSWNEGRVCAWLIVRSVSTDGTAQVQYGYVDNHGQRVFQSGQSQIQDNKLIFKDKGGSLFSFTFDRAETGAIRQLNGSFIDSETRTFDANFERLL